jgi:hypothetical protein
MGIAMSAIAATGSSNALNAGAQILGNGASSATSGIPQIGEATVPASSAPSTNNPTDSLDLSDHAKAALAGAATDTPSDQAKAAVAAKAQSDQAAADRLQAYVEAHRVTGTKTTATDSLQSIFDTSIQPTGTQPADAQPTTGGSKVEAIVAQITTIADANQPPPFQTFTPTKSLSNSVTVDGFTLTLDTNASTQFYGVELSGNGVQAFNKHFGPSDGAGGGTALPSGIETSFGIPNSNNEALDAITVTQNIATASSASISSSSAGSVSTSSVNAQSSSITFLVNYATGQIGVEQSAASVSAQSTRVGAPGSTLSTLA